MATCPSCGATAPDDAVSCPACGTRLGADSGDTLECPNCGNRVPADGESCPACGQVQVPTLCTTHPDRQAEGACVVCGLALCQECDRGEGTEYVCEAHQEVPIVDGWAEVFNTGDDIEADLIRDNLLAEGLDAQVLSQKDHFSFTVDIGDLAQVRVLVPAFEYEEAMRILAAREDRTDDLPVTCPACGAAYEPGDPACGACGASLVEATGA